MPGARASEGGACRCEGEQVRARHPRCRTRTLARGPSDLERQAVVGELDAGGQRGVGRRVRQVVADVREIGLPRREALDDRQRLGDREVRGMRAMAQRVEDQGVEAVEQRPRLVGDAIAVGQIGEAAEAEPEDRPRAVQTAGPAAREADRATTDRRSSADRSAGRRRLSDPAHRTRSRTSAADRRRSARRRRRESRAAASC